jgi:hypothetical protein
VKQPIIYSAVTNQIGQIGGVVRFSTRPFYDRHAPGFSRGAMGPIRKFPFAIIAYGRENIFMSSLSKLDYKGFKNMNEALEELLEASK